MNWHTGIHGSQIQCILMHLMTSAPPSGSRLGVLMKYIPPFEVTACAVKLKAQHGQSEARSEYRVMVCLRLAPEGKRKTTGVCFLHFTTRHFLFSSGSEQFARLDGAKSFSSSVDFVSVNLSFPHSPFLPLCCLL